MGLYTIILGFAAVAAALSPGTYSDPYSLISHFAHLRPLLTLLPVIHSNELTGHFNVSQSANSSALRIPGQGLLRPDRNCRHGAHDRGCWEGGHSIVTDFDNKWPAATKTVTYDWEVTNGTCNPDGGFDRVCLLINGQYPGPPIHASWGDNIQINLKNSLENNGTGIHWHGLRQFNSTEYDGTPGLTECPLAPGDKKTYLFQATQ